MTGNDKAKAIAEFLRAPAAFSAIGDPLVGAYASGNVRPRQLLTPIASVLIYAGGMGLNDWADRELDAQERPERPIPSGRITAEEALRISAGLIGAGVLTAGLIGGRRGLARAAVLAGTVVAYDTDAKDTPAGSWVMAACRSLNVLLGAGSLTAALSPALTVGAHTVAVTELSRAEVHGAEPTLPEGVRTAVAAVAAVATLAGRGAGFETRPRRSSATVGRPSGRSSATVGRPTGRSSVTARGLLGRAAAAAAAYRYLDKAIPPLNRAIEEPTGARIRDAVRANLGALIPLQAALIARTGNLAPAAVVASLELAQRQVIRRLRGDTT